MRTAAFWRALERARDTNAKTIGRGISDGITRRRVLAAMGAGAATAALPGCLRAGPQRIAIVGGGLAGLSALDRLRAMGADAMLYEARGATGGRTRSMHGVFSPDYAFDEGGQLVNSDHSELIALIRRLGLTLIDRKNGPEAELQIGPAAAVDEAALAEGLREIAAQIAADADRLDKDYAAVAREIDPLSVRDYLDRHGMKSGDARDAIEATIRTEYGAEPEEASAIELLFNLPTVDGERVTRLSLSDERYLVEGGTQGIARALAAPHMSAVRLGKKLAAVDFTRPEIRLAFEDGEEARFDRVILALPAPLLRTIHFEGPLPDLWRTCIAEVKLGRCEKLIAGYDRTPWRKTIGTGGALWSAQGFSEGWDAASARTSDSGPGALTYFMAGAQVPAASGSSPSDLAERFGKLARRVLPELPQSNGRLRRTRWCDDPLTQGAYMNFAPGQFTRFGALLTLEEGAAPRPSQAGPLLFAGEWLSDAWPGYMNGAVQTGRIAADAAMQVARAAAHST